MCGIGGIMTVDGKSPESGVPVRPQFIVMSPPIPAAALKPLIEALGGSGLKPEEEVEEQFFQKPRTRIAAFCHRNQFRRYSNLSPPTPKSWR